MTVILRLATAIGVLTFLACSSTPVAEQPRAEGTRPASTDPSASGPQWLRDAMAREAALAEMYEFASEDGLLHARASAPLAGPIVQTEEFYYLLLDIGSDIPVECFIYNEEVDLASALYQTSLAALDAIAQALGAFKNRAILGTDAGMVAEVPYLAIDWFYIVDDGQGSAGQLKERIANTGENGIGCQHNELGYSQSFAQIFGEIVESVRSSRSMSSEPYYRELWTASVGARKIGIQELNMRLDADGDTQMDVAVSMLIPVAPDQASSLDSYDIEFSRPDGTVINKINIETQNFEVTTDLRFGPEDLDTWLVHGKFQTKEFEARIPRDGPLYSQLGQIWALRKAIAEEGVGASLSFPIWSSLDPSQLVQSSVTVTGERPDGMYDATFTIGPVEMDGVVASDGTMTQGELSAGHVSIVLQRVFVDGEF